MCRLTYSKVFIRDRAIFKNHLNFQLKYVGLSFHVSCFSAVHAERMTPCRKVIYKLTLIRSYIAKDRDVFNRIFIFIYILRYFDCVANEIFCNFRYSKSKTVSTVFRWLSLFIRFQSHFILFSSLFLSKQKRKKKMNMFFICLSAINVSRSFTSINWMQYVLQLKVCTLN